MKKKLFLSLSIMAIVATIFTAKSINKNADVSSLMMQNIEALTQGEGQPDVNDCISAYSWICIALHPTNPALDIEVVNKRW